MIPSNPATTQASILDRLKQLPLVTAVGARKPEECCALGGLGKVLGREIGNFPGCYDGALLLEYANPQLRGEKIEDGNDRQIPVARYLSTRIIGANDHRDFDKAIELIRLGLEFNSDNPNRLEEIKNVTTTLARQNDPPSVPNTG